MDGYGWTISKDERVYGDNAQIVCESVWEAVRIGQ